MDKFSDTADKAKGVAILLVVLGHIASPLGDTIYSFHVPLFFFLAGLFIKTSHSEITYLNKGLQRLILPFVIFGTVGFLATLIKNFLLHRPIEPVAESLAGLFYWSDAEHMHHYGLVLWFLPALFWGRTSAFLLLKHIRLHPAFQMLITIILAWLTARYLDLPFGLDKGLVALPWILSGYLFYLHRNWWLSDTRYIAMGLVLFCSALVYITGIQPLNLANKYIGNPLSSLPYTIGLILLIFWLLHQGNKRSAFSNSLVSAALSQFGRDSMLVLVLHIYTNNVADILVTHILGAGYWYITFAVSVGLVYTAMLVKRSYADSPLFRYL